MSLFGKIGIIAAVLFLVLSLSLLVPLPQRVIALPGLTSFVLDGPLFLGVALAALVAVASDSIVRGHPACRNARLGYTLTFWPLPCMLTAWGIVKLYAVEGLFYQQLGSLALVLLVAAVLAAQYHGITPPDERAASGIDEWFLTLVAGGLGLLLWWANYDLAAPPWRVALGSGAVSAALALEWLRARERFGQSWLQSMIIGLCLGELGWFFAVGGLSPLVALIAFFALLYYVVNLLQQITMGRIARSAGMVYGLLAVVGLGLFWYFMPWR